MSVSFAPARLDGSEPAPTVRAPVATPGALMVPGASPELPAATTTTVPAATAASTARLPASDPSEDGLPSDIEITRTSGRAAHHSMAATTSESAPDPPESSTLAPTRDAARATPPYCGLPAPLPAAIDETWVPWPWSS